ncbi:MAG TPA: hypothetical protein PLH56_00360 [Candidatus Omnitrophota bacterium]|nr:hypothetical protein [Candidatus Omnitrophota bacterium]
MQTTISKLRLLSLSQKIFTAAIFLWLCLNLLSFSKEIHQYEKLRAYLPHQFVGNKFREFQPFLKEIPVIGYYTDKNLNDLDNNKQLSQAQLILAPTILDVHNIQHDYIILDCSTSAKTVEKIKELNLTPLKITPSGIILARKK